MFDYYPTISEASRYSDIPIPKWLKWIKQGLILANPELPDSADIDATSKLTRIPLSALPRFAATRFLQANLLKESFSSVDLVSVHFAGELSKVLDEVAMLKVVADIRCKHHGNFTPHLQRFAASHNTTLSTIFRKEALLMKSDLRKLIPAVAAHPHSHALCDLSRDYLVFHFLRPNHPSQAQLLVNLQKESLAHGKGVCRRCAYKKTCACIGSGMLFPDNRYPVNRFLKTVTDQEAEFSRKGRNAWEAHFAHKTIRDKPEYINAVWFGDHHLGDCVVIIGWRKDKKPILARPWLTVVTDAASDAIVGSVVSIHPNSQTIAECFCRAAAFTIDSPFYGLPEVFYVDCEYVAQVEHEVPLRLYTCGAEIVHARRLNCTLIRRAIIVE